MRLFDVLFLSLTLFTVNGAALTNGTVKIIKDANPNSSQDFRFTMSNVSPGSFFLDDDSDVTLSNTKTLVVENGNYIVTEDQAAGWHLTRITCTESNGIPNSTTDVATRTATIGVEIGETVTCLFTNSLITPAETVISGRILTLNGRGIKQANVTVVDLNTNTIFSVSSNTFGYYRVPGIRAGSFCQISVSHKTYVFSDIFVGMNEDLSGLDFISNVNKKY